jgi:lipoate-protein ligase B
VDALWLGRVSYRPAWDLQERLCAQVQAGGPEVLLLCEHEPVITLGHSATDADLLAPPVALLQQGIECVRTSRGGQATYHGPGQLVIYPIVRLSKEYGVVAHVQALGQAAAAVAAGLGVVAAFCRDPVGVFVGERKLAAIGVKVKRRVTLHGLALNVRAEAAAAFRGALFVPCGRAGAPVTSLEEETGQALALSALAEPLAQAFCRCAGRTGPVAYRHA